MYNDDQEIVSCSNFKYSIDFSNVTLTQNTISNQLLFSGGGCIYQNEDGKLKLKISHHVLDMGKDLEHVFYAPTPGVLLDDDRFFSMVAVDDAGRKWTADNILIAGTTSFPTKTMEIHTDVDQVVCDQDLNEKRYARQKIVALCLGKTDLTCLKAEKLSDGGAKLSIAEFSAKGVNYQIKKRDDYLVIIAEFDSDNFDHNEYKRLLEPLSISLGMFLSPVFVEHVGAEHHLKIVKSASGANGIKKLQPPFDYRNGVKQIACFTEQYLSVISKPFSVPFGYWYRINQGFSSTITNSSLVLSVSIDGMLQFFFKELGHIDNDMKTEMEDAIAFIEGSSVGKRVRERLLGSLKLLQNSSPKSILYTLVSKGFISNKMMKAWVSLRNQSAHPAEVEMDRQKFQKYLNRHYSCLSLFYLILFCGIGYEGEYTDYSQPGWPDKFLRADKELLKNRIEI